MRYRRCESAAGDGAGGGQTVTSGGGSGKTDRGNRVTYTGCQNFETAAKIVGPEK